jgi:hypothetical protein
MKLRLWIGMERNGTECYFYFHYSVSENTTLTQSEIDRINSRINAGLLTITDVTTYDKLIAQIDSIGPQIENLVHDEHGPNDLTVMKIGLPEFFQEFLPQIKVNLNRVKIISSDEIKNYANHTDLNLQEKSKSEDLSLILRTRYNSELPIDYVIYFSDQRNSMLPIDVLNQHIEEVIVDSIRQFNACEIYSTKKDSVEMMMKKIIEINYPEANRVLITDVELPTEAEKWIHETETTKHEIMEDLFKMYDEMESLNQKLETSKTLSKSEILEIEKNIEILEMDIENQRKIGKSISDDCKF